MLKSYPDRGHVGVPVSLSGPCSLKLTGPRYGLCCARRRHQASSSPQGEGRPCFCGCRLQTTYDWPQRCRKSRVPRHPATGHGSCGSPCWSRKMPLPWSSRTAGRGVFLRCCHIQVSSQHSPLRAGLYARAPGSLRAGCPSCFSGNPLTHWHAARYRPKSRSGVAGSWGPARRSRAPRWCTRPPAAVRA